jgi:hypothetical protein
MNREQQKTKEDLANEVSEIGEIKLGKRLGSDIIYESRENESNNTTSDLDGVKQPMNDKDNLEKLIRGINNYKRLFIG